jgi:hypothetical protein
MLLQKVAHFNDLSPKLRKEVEDKVRSFGKVVRYKFDISNPNPDPTRHGGITTIWPTVYTLDPCVFNINDPYETRDGISRSKRIAIIDGIDEKGLPNKFRKVKVHGRLAGMLSLHLDNDEQFSMACYIEMHPKLKGGMFSDKTKRQLIERMDEQATAIAERKERSARKIAMDTAEKMTDAEVMEFADGMAWDSGENILTLRNKVEDLAEHSPQMFNDLISDKKVKYQAAIKRAIDKRIWALHPMECKISWVSTSQNIVALGTSTDGRSDYERLAEWFMTAGKKADEAYNKLLALEKADTVVNS